MTVSSPSLARRLRTDSNRRSTYERRTVGSVRPRTMQDVRRPAASSAVTATPTLAAAPVVRSKSGQAQPSFPRTKGRTMRARTARSEVLRRDIVAQAQPATKKRRRKGGMQAKVLTLAAVGLCLLGVGVGLSGFRTNHTVEAQVSHLQKQAAATDTGAATPAAAPAESKPAGGVAGYHVAADLPREIKIDKLGVDARILRLGVLADNSLATPGNIFDTGWYDGSAKPGEAAAMLIDGHVSGPTQNGVFYGIKNLVKGDKITVQRGDGKLFTYDVVTSKVYDAGNMDMAAALTPAVAGKPGLNLITCTGKLDSSKTHFQQRVLVFAVQE